jgi:hypothetical protein
MQFFAKLNYRRARAVRARAMRHKAYLTVFRAFGYRHLPPFEDFYGFMHGTRTHALLRRAKRMLLPGAGHRVHGGQESGS